MKKIFFRCCFLICVIAISSCDTNDSKEVIESNHAAGELKIIADDTFKPLLGTMIETFNSINPKAKVEVKYSPQRAAFNSLLAGEVDLIIAGRPLEEDEINNIKKTGLKPKVNAVAYDALVFIVHKENPINAISMDSLQALLTGKLKGSLVCDKSNSENLLYLQHHFSLDQELKNIKSSGSDSSVVEYISTHNQAIGVVGMAYLSDKDDKQVSENKSAIKLLSIRYKDSLGIMKASYPVQEEVALKKYPFIRTIFVINLDGSQNLGTGFANHLVGERGQRIILKSGLMPFKMPGRELLIK